MAIPTLVRRRIGGRGGSYAALLLGLGLLILGEAFRLGAVLRPDAAPTLAALGQQFPLHSGGFVLVLLGFLSLMNDLKVAQTEARRDAMSQRARAEEARLQQAKLRAILDGATDYCIITCDLNGQITSYSTGGTQILGWDPREVVGKKGMALLHPPEQPFPLKRVIETVRTLGRFEAESPMVRKDGRTIPVLLTITPLTGPDGQMKGLIGIARDITETKDVQNALRRERDFVRGIIETSQLFIVAVSLADGRMTMFNHGAELTSGFRRDDVIGREYTDVLLSQEDRPAFRKAVEDARAGGFSLSGQQEHTIVTRLGESRVIAWNFSLSSDEAGRPLHAVGFGHDVTEQRRLQASLEQAKSDLERANDELARLATTDYLTGLLNRRQTDALFEREMARSRRNQTPVGVLMLDLDHFKAINDTHGHEVGDACLKHVADVFRGRLRANDIVGRYGGEEFLIILPDTNLEEAAFLAEVVRARISEAEVAHGDLRIRLTTSAGVTVLDPRQEVSADELVRRADEALYGAKGLGGDHVQTWQSPQPQNEPSYAKSE